MAHPLHTFRHEIAHAIQLEHRLNDPLWDSKLSEIRKIMSKVDNSDVSLYAFDSIDEFISECIAESMTKKCELFLKKLLI